MPIGLIGGKYSTSKPISRMRGILPITSTKVPWRFSSSLIERGKISYQLAKRAAARSASTRYVTGSRDRNGRWRAAAIAFAVSAASTSASLRSASAFVNSLTMLFERFLGGAFGRLHFGEDQREQVPRFLEFEFDRLPGLQLLLHVIDERREVVAPRRSP